jgi:hypothetical protein
MHARHNRHEHPDEWREPCVPKTKKTITIFLHNNSWLIKYMHTFYGVIFQNGNYSVSF